MKATDPSSNHPRANEFTIPVPEPAERGSHSVCQIETYVCWSYFKTTVTMWLDPVLLSNTWTVTDWSSWFGHLSRVSRWGCVDGPPLRQEHWVSAALSPRPCTCTRRPAGAAALRTCRSSSMVPLPRLHLTFGEKTCNRCRAINGFVHASDSETTYR